MTSQPEELSEKPSDHNSPSNVTEFHQRADCTETGTVVADQRGSSIGPAGAKLIRLGGRDCWNQQRSAACLWTRGRKVFTVRGQ